MTDRGAKTSPSLSASDEPRTPVAGELGLSSTRPQRMADDTVAAWRTFAGMLYDLAEAGRFDTRLRSTDSDGRHHTVRDIAIGIGTWPEARTVAAMVADAEQGLVGDFDQDPVTDHLRRQYAGTSDDEILAAVDVSVSQVAEFAENHATTPLAVLPVRSLLGTLPVLTLLHAATYQLAVYALDIAAASTSRVPMPAAPDGFDYAGVVALVDVTGAIAARQHVSAAIAARTPDGVVASRAAVIDGVGAWHTITLPAGTKVSAPSVTARSHTFIEVTTGRVANIPALIVKRELVLDDVSGLLHITPVLEGVPGLPGGGALRAATASVRTMAGLGSGIGGRLSKLTHWRG